MSGRKRGHKRAAAAGHLFLAEREGGTAGGMGEGGRGKPPSVQ